MICRHDGTLKRLPCLRTKFPGVSAIGMMTFFGSNMPTIVTGFGLARSLRPPHELGWERNAQGSTDFMGWANEEQPQTSQESKGVAELLHQAYPSESELSVKSLKCCTQCFTIVKFREKQMFSAYTIYGREASGMKPASSGAYRTRCTGASWFLRRGYRVGCGNHTQNPGLPEC